MRDDRAAGSKPAVWFAYSPDCKGVHPQDRLKTFRGILQADAYTGFHEIYTTGRVVSTICWARAKRKFHDLSNDTSSPLAKEALRRTGQLYDTEREIDELMPEERLKQRQNRAKPLLDALEK